MKVMVFWSPMLLAAALSPAFLYSDCSPKTGNANLVSLELEAGGINRIVSFDNAVTSYNVWLDGATTMTVRGQTEDPTSEMRWGLGTEYGSIGIGSGELTFDTPADDTALAVTVLATGGRTRTFSLIINPPCTGSECDDNNSCTSNACNASVCEFATEPDGTPCTDANGGQDQCLAGMCPSNAVTQSFSMGCTSNIFGGWWPATWTVTIDPLTPVVAGQPFDVALSGEVSIETLLDGLAANLYATYPRTYSFGSVPILPRSGATGSATADISDGGGPHVCAFDVASCDPANDTGGMFTPNSDCSGIQSDWCLPFADQTVIDDTGNACATCIAADVFDFYSSGSGIGLKQVLCENTPFGQLTNMCTDAATFALVPQTQTFVAQPGASEVLFGFEEGDPVFNMNPPAVWNDGVGVDVAEYLLSVPGGTTQGTIQLAANCYMGVASYDSSTDPLTPLPDSALISIPVESIPTGATIEFDDGIESDPIGSHYAAQGVTFDSNTVWVPNGVGDCYDFGGATAPLSISVPGIKPTFDNPIIATFSAPQSLVSILAVNVGSAGARLDAYDAVSGGNLVGFAEDFGSTVIGELTTGGEEGCLPCTEPNQRTCVHEERLLSVSAPSIRRVEIYRAVTQSIDGVFFDNLTFEP